MNFRLQNIKNSPDYDKIERDLYFFSLQAEITTDNQFNFDSILRIQKEQLSNSRVATYLTHEDDKDNLCSEQFNFGCAYANILLSQFPSTILQGQTSMFDVCIKLPEADFFFPSYLPVHKVSDSNPSFLIDFYVAICEVFAGKKRIRDLEKMLNRSALKSGHKK